MTEAFKTGVISKQEIRGLYNISPTTLRNLLNKKYLEQLEAVGYSRFNNYLSPKQWQLFRDLYGDP